MVNSAKGRLLKRKDGKYLIYLPVGLAQDSMFPLKVTDSMPVKVSFKMGETKILIEPHP
jgi:hypothetical protein